MADLERHRYLSLFFACVLATCASGIFYGWPQLYTILLTDGVYSSLCRDAAICDEQKAALSRTYEYAAALNLLSQLVWGYHLDTNGPRLACATALFTVISGFVLLASTLRGGALVSVAVCLIAFGGPGVQISLFHISELFPNAKSTVLAIIAGAFQMSFTVFYVLRQTAIQLTLSVQQVIGAYTLILLALTACSVYVWPDAPCQSPADADHIKFTADDEDANTAPTERTPLTARPSPLLSIARERRQQMRDHNLRGAAFGLPLRQQIVSPQFILCAVWMCVCVYWANDYVGAVVEELYRMSNNDPRITRAYTDLFNLTLPIGIFGIPLFSAAIRFGGFTAAIATTSALGITFAAGKVYSELWIQPVTFIAYALHRTFLFSVMFAYLADEFSYRHFGLLSGIVLALSGATTALQMTVSPTIIAAVANAANVSEERIINTTQLACMTSTLVFAIFTFYQQRSRTQMAKEAQPQRLERVLEQ